MYRVLCKIGFHHWSNVEYVSEEACKEIRYCTRCHIAQEVGFHHTWHQREALSDKCKYRRTCTRCNESEVEEDHRWVFSKQVTGGGGTRRGMNVDFEYDEYRCSVCGETKSENYKEW